MRMSWQLFVLQFIFAIALCRGAFLPHLPLSLLKIHHLFEVYHVILCRFQETECFGKKMEDAIICIFPCPPSVCYLTLAALKTLKGYRGVSFISDGRIALGACLPSSDGLSLLWLRPLALL